MRFSAIVDDDNSELNNLVFKSKTVDNLTAQILLSEAYDIDYGIFDHNTSSNEDVLKLVAKHAVEDVDQKTLLDIYTERFVLLDVYETTGLSLDRFWKLDRVEADKLLELCAKRKEQESAAAAAAANMVENTIDNVSKPEPPS